MQQTSTESFFAAIPAFTQFSEVAHPKHYHSLPDNWLVGVADVVDSTGAIGRGEYKAVNMVGASIISAVINRLGHREFPFVFGGDGAAFAVPARFEGDVREVAAAVQTWAKEEMGLTLRAAIFPLSEIRRAGHDVKVARFAVAPELAYAMFSGGGISWAESEMKAGRYLVPPAAAGTRPDLTGLSCRWEPINSERGEIVSLLVLPQPGTSPEAFGTLVGTITRYLDDPERIASPVQPATLRFAWPPKGIALEAKAAGRRLFYSFRYIGLALFTLMGWFLFRFNVKFFSFDPKLYREETSRNSDFRKFDDGLKLTLDSRSEAIEQLTRMLEDAEQKGIAHYGIHRQDQALMTCIVPSVLMRDHLHFIDGAGGGYAKAAENLKRQIRLSSRKQPAQGRAAS
jgi:hypothetical protein